MLLFIGEALGGAQGLVIGFVFAVVTNFGSYWFSDKIVLRMYRAKEVGPGHRLYQIVAALAQRAGLPMPKVYIIPEPSPNAFATGRNPEHAAVAATEGILRVLDERRARRRDRARAGAREAPRHPDQLGRGDARRGDHDGVALRDVLRRRPRRDDREGANPIALLATIILAPIAAMLIQAAISRSREFAADAGGAAIAGGPHGLVNALRKIEAASQRGAARRQPGHGAHVHHQAVQRVGLARLFSTHPPTEQRIQALLQQD